MFGTTERENRIDAILKKKKKSSMRRLKSNHFGVIRFSSLTSKYKPSGK